MIERTLVLLKPDALRRGAVRSIVARFESLGITILAGRTIRLTAEQCNELYHMHREQPYYNHLLAHMTSGPSLALVLQGEGAVAQVRGILGDANPGTAEPGTIRADFGTSEEANCAHASDSLEQAIRELAILFPDVLDSDTTALDPSVDPHVPAVATESWLPGKTIGEVARAVGGVVYVGGLHSAGKTTMVKAALDALKWLSVIPTVTTRSPRPSEAEGSCEYGFAAREEYEQRRLVFPAWANTNVGSDSYGVDSEGVNAGIANGNWYIVSAPLDPHALESLRSRFVGHHVVIWIDVHYSVCAERVKSRGVSGEHARLLAQRQAADLRRSVDGEHVFVSVGQLDLDAPRFVEFIKRAVRVCSSDGTTSVKPPKNIEEHNRQAWEQKVAMHDRWTVPVTSEQVAEARQGSWEVVLTPRRSVPRSWFPSLGGCKVLALACGGGQQGPILSAAGADVTIFDISDAQLEQDRIVARRDGLALRTVQGDMGDLSRFGGGSFDVVFNPVSNVFVPDVRRVWSEVHRVLRDDGVCMAGFINPILFAMDRDLESIGVAQFKYRVPYSDTECLNSDALAAQIRLKKTLKFAHTMEDQLGGQVDAGLVIDGVYEDSGDKRLSPIHRYVNCYMATRSRKR